MDATLQGTQVSANEYPTWDYFVSGDIVPIIVGSEEEDQRAAVSGFLQKGSIPQLPDVGIAWVEYLLGEVPLTEIDTQIRDTLTRNGLSNFDVAYDIINDKMSVKILRRAA